jgi:hypothetical protein
MGKDNFTPNPNNNPYRSGNSPTPQQTSGNPSGTFIDFNTQRVCPACGKAININHNFCKFCGVDLSEIEPIGKTQDKVTKQLAITAVSDPDASVRKEALDTLGSFKEKKILGLLTYVLFHDPDPECRKEAADELGDLHHPYSLEALAAALKDENAEVRKEAIEGLKKIKEKNKPKKQDKGKPKEKIEKSEEKEEKSEEREVKFEEIEEKSVEREVEFEEKEEEF